MVVIEESVAVNGEAGVSNLGHGLFRASIEAGHVEHRCFRASPHYENKSFYT